MTMLLDRRDADMHRSKWCGSVRYGRRLRDYWGLFRKQLRLDSSC